MKLARSELHLWLAFDRELDDPALAEAFDSLLDAGERERSARLRVQEHSRQFVATRALQRSVLSHYVPEVAPGDWQFVPGARGKPGLAPQFDSCGLSFNLSHTEGLVAMAVTCAGQVGVDAECLTARAAPLALAARYFSPREARELEAMPAKEQQKHFYRLWTLKEAWLKATGAGVAEGLASVTFEFDRAGELGEVAIPGEGMARWQFWQGQPGDGHLVAIAASNPWAPLALSVFRRLPAVELQYQDEPALRLVAEVSGQEQRAQT